MKTGMAQTVSRPGASRRRFLQRLVLAPALVPGFSRATAASRASRQVRFGLIADIHPDVLPDGLERVQAFVGAMRAAQVDFIVQLGDFVWPAPVNRRYLDAWNAYPGSRYHVLGNHDMDEGYTREQTVEFCGMPGMHYTFSAGPAMGVVLDGNEPGGQASGYRRFVGPEQLAWLEHQLAVTKVPVMLFIHQPFDADLADYVENGAAVRAVVEQAEQRRPGTIAAVFSGHLHLDYARVVNGIQYVEINSAAYWWLNNPAARRETYPPEVHQEYRYASHVAAYRDPLWAIVTLDLEHRELFIEGRRSEWIGPDPWTRGEITDRPREFLHPVISHRRLALNGSPGGFAA